MMTIAKVNNITRTILGIDPGTLLMGYGLIQQTGNKLTYIEMGILNLRKEKDPLIKLRKIHQEIERLIDVYKPDQVSIESPFYGKNPQSLIKLGRAQGVAIAAAMNKGVEVFEYAPLRIKQSITGNGNASKEQVCRMLFNILHINEEQPKFLDSSDALAAAVCHAMQQSFPEYSIDKHLSDSSSAKKGKKKPSGWESFLSQNPERIKR